jgi:citrate synthase
VDEINVDLINVDLARHRRDTRHMSSALHHEPARAAAGPPLIEVPPGLNGVAVTDTGIGDVRGDLGSYHYRGYDAVQLARTRSLEEVWFLLHEGRLPTADETRAFARHAGEQRVLPAELLPIIDVAARGGTGPLARLRTVLSAAAPVLGLGPMLDLAPAERGRQALRLAALVPSVLAALHRTAHGLPLVAADPSSSHTADYVRQVTGSDVDPVTSRALERYLMLTIDHGFNASTFTARVVASTGADLADCVCAALGALAGPLHGGAPGRALDALDAIGPAERAPDWVRGEVQAGRRIMGFGHAVYRDVDPRSTLLREIAVDQTVVAKVSRLARLDLRDHEIETMTAELSDMLDHFADIDALDHLAAIDAREGEIHAFNLVLADQARAAAAAVDAGWPPATTRARSPACPVALKDNLCTRGVPTTCSSKILEGWRPPYDATVVQRLAAAGAVVDRQDQPRRVRHGLEHRELGLRPTRNPHDTTRVPGGSSGGSAAAVAAGFAPVASAATPAARSASPPRCAAWSG